jgi:hypothetical protein
MKRRFFFLAIVLLISKVSFGQLSPNELRFNIYNYNFFVNNEYKGVRVSGYTLPGFRFTPTISYNLNDGKGKIEKTEHVVHKLTNADEPTTPSDPVTPPTDDDKKKGCKKDLTALVVGIISLSTLGVVIKKREK